MRPDRDIRISGGKSDDLLHWRCLSGGTRIQTHTAPDPHPELFRQDLSFVIYPTISVVKIDERNVLPAGSYPNLEHDL
jgi:hypothetical protein